VAAGHAGYGDKILMVTAGMSARVFRRFRAGRVWQCGRPKGDPARGRPGSARGRGLPRAVAHRVGAQVLQGVFERARQQGDCRPARSYRRGGEGFIAAIIPKDPVCGPAASSSQSRWRARWERFGGDTCGSAISCPL
jgi:hypothetical protein